MEQTNTIPGFVALNPSVSRRNTLNPTKKNIYGIIGDIGCGKDTIAGYLIDNFGFRKMSFAGRVKDVAPVGITKNRHRDVPGSYPG